LTNYWGYNTIGYFAPHQAYSAAVRAGQPGGQVPEFKAMVNALHRAGLEVLLDVVFNHTAEGGQLGPTLCFRGLDNPAYYRLDEENPRCYYDTTGTGNSLNTGDPVTLRLILALRARQSRAMLATLLLSFGVPLLGGDEIGRTQLGNNNAYCQDNELTWFDWEGADHTLLGFTRQVIALRKAHPVFRRRRFLAGTEVADLRWFTPAGSPMSPADWADGSALAVALYLDGSDAPDRAADGAPLLDDDFLVLVNAWWEPLDFVLPETRAGARWHTEVDTFGPPAADPGTLAGPAVAGRAGDRLAAGPRPVVVLRSPRPAGR
jgi:isoamylase